MNTPKVSVVMPAYNRGYCIGRSIESVLKQTFTDFEFIIVDNGSSDNTRDVIRHFDDARIRLVSLEMNRGCAYALNIGYSMAAGAYIARIDSDDLWMPEKLEKQVAYMDTHAECGVCFSYSRLIDMQERDNSAYAPNLWKCFHMQYDTQAEYLHHIFHKGNLFCNPSNLMRREVFEQIGRYNVACWVNEDMEYWIRVLSKYPIHVLQEELVQYRFESDSDQMTTCGYEYLKGVMNLVEQMRYHFFDYMTDEDFIAWFRNDFRNPSSHTPAELLCEKAFLQIKYPYEDVDMTQTAVHILEDMLQLEEGADTLLESFGMTLKDVHEMRKKHCVIDLPGQKPREVELAEAQQHAANLQAQIDALKSTRSYKAVQRAKQILRRS